jgi:hypothetical protein
MMGNPGGSSIHPGFCYSTVSPRWILTKEAKKAKEKSSVGSHLGCSSGQYDNGVAHYVLQ